MIRFTGRGLLLDIEGTVASIRYVFDVLFPYARRGLPQFLAANWDSSEVAAAREMVAADAGAPSFAQWCGAGSATEQQRRLWDHLAQLMDRDVKATGLKQFQGLVWRQGYLDGELLSEVFADVPPALKAWNQARRDVRIFSSGSVAAQKLFFAHTQLGDLTPYLRGYYDTTLGPKREPASYAMIAARMELPPSEILFCSDIVGELDAACDAGMVTALAARPGNAAVEPDHGHLMITNLNEIELTSK